MSQTTVVPCFRCCGTHAAMSNLSMVGSLGICYAQSYTQLYAPGYTARIQPYAGTDKSTGSFTSFLIDLASSSNLALSDLSNPHPCRLVPSRKAEYDAFLYHPRRASVAFDGGLHVGQGPRRITYGCGTIAGQHISLSSLHSATHHAAQYQTQLPLLLAQLCANIRF
jgi:hypothetical protein